MDGAAHAGAGGEGMVGNSLANLDPDRRRLTQPGAKVRGQEYLRIIHGPNSIEPAHLERLRSRNLGHKRYLHCARTRWDWRGLPRVSLTRSLR